MSTTHIIRLACGLLLLAACGMSQTVTSTLSGTVADPSNASVSDAGVQLKNQNTGELRETKTTSEGFFRFNSVPSGPYTLTIKGPGGFKSYVQANIQLISAEIRDLGTIHLEVGGTSESITVTAEVTPVQISSAEKSSVLDNSQLREITLKGNNVFAAMNVLPGVFITTGNSFLETTNAAAFNNVQINGQSSAKINMTVDGVTNLDTGNNGQMHYEPNLDSVVEVRVLSSNYQAQYGRESGGQIALVTKSGTRAFHGTAWATKRHEMFDANNYFNNLQGNPRPTYRYFVDGYTLGGPAYIPKKWNVDKNKLFFFVSNEWSHTKPGTSFIYAQVPTAAERAGDFSHTVQNSNGAPIAPLLDPTTRQPIPNNIIPQSLVANNSSAPFGQAMLNFFPLPNRCDLNGSATGCYNELVPSQLYRRNYLTTYTDAHSLRNDTVRVDAIPTRRLSLWFRYINNYDMDVNGTGAVDFRNSTGNFAPFLADHPNSGHGYAAYASYVFSPTVINEITVGKSWNSWDWYPHDPSQLDRSQMANPPSFNNFATDPNFTADKNMTRPGLAPGAQNFQVGIPAVTFGGLNVSQTNISNSGSGGVFPYTNFNNIYSVQDNLSVSRGSHNLKTGIYFERTEKLQNAGQGNYLGSYNFGTNSSWPQDTGNGYANAYLGNIQSYSEGKRIVGDYWFQNIEFFVQDNWHVSKNLTLDIGVRFYHMPPPVNEGNSQNASAVWLPSAYNPAQTPRLYYPTCTNATATACLSLAAVDPGTGKTAPFALAGTFVVGSGNPFNGMVIAGSNPQVPQSIYTVSALSAAARVGLSWNVFGDGKTAIRAGFGQAPNRGDGNQIMGFGGQPPVTYSQSILYTNVAAVPTFANAGAITPSAPGGIVGRQKFESTISASFGVQRDVGFHTVLDVAWQGVFTRHAPIGYPINAIPMYSEYNPAYFDPTKPGVPANASGKNINDNYFRPIPGFGNMTQTVFAGDYNYHALQVLARRNMYRRLSYTVAYTFSKSVGFSAISPYSNIPMFKQRNYGPTTQGNAPHNIAATYVFTLPNVAARLHVRPARWVTDGWVLAGVTEWHSWGVSGVPSVGFTGAPSNGPNWTGSAEGNRPVVIGSAGSAFLDANGNAASNPDFYHTFNWQGFIPAQPCSLTNQNYSCFGNAGAGQIVKLPSWENNWDMSLSKQFSLKREGTFVSLRADVFNAPNHTQFWGINTNITYDYTAWTQGTLKQTNTALGQYTSTAPERRMMVSAHLTF